MWKAQLLLIPYWEVGLLLLFFKDLSMALSLQASILQLFLPCVTKNILTKPRTEWRSIWGPPLSRNHVGT